MFFFLLLKIWLFFFFLLQYNSGDQSLYPCFVFGFFHFPLRFDVCILYVRVMVICPQNDT